MNRTDQGKKERIKKEEGRKSKREERRLRKQRKGGQKERRKKRKKTQTENYAWEGIERNAKECKERKEAR